MVAQTTPDHVESQKTRYGKSEISTENPDFEFNFEFKEAASKLWGNGGG